jgi:hypothetical protein
VTRLPALDPAYATGKRENLIGPCSSEPGYHTQVANAMLNIFTNYFNQVVQTEIDFPRVELLTPTSL